jgi:hypothetical protein
MRNAIATAALLLTALGAEAVAQEQANMQRPTNFRVRYDRANAVDSLFHFVNMRPGWHVTSGRFSAIMWNPELNASGNFRVESLTHLFPAAGHAEGFGLVLGGRDLDGAGQSYLYFLIRKDGQFLIRTRNAAATADVVPWTAHAAITPQPATDSTASSVRNTLAVEASAQAVDFFVNGQRVHTMPRRGATIDGLVGFRVNHGLNLHLQTLELTRR